MKRHLHLYCTNAENDVDHMCRLSISSSHGVLTELQHHFIKIAFRVIYGPENTATVANLGLNHCKVKKFALQPHDLDAALHIQFINCACIPWNVALCLLKTKNTRHV